MRKNHRWGKKNSKEVREKISKANKGKKIHSLEWRKKFSEERSGSGNPMYGVRLENSGMSGKKHNQSFFEKKSTLLLNTITGIYYYGFKEAGDTIGMKKDTLAAKLRGQIKNDTYL